MSLDQLESSGRDGARLDRFVAELREHWGEVRFSLDGHWYERAYGECERVCEELGLMPYVRQEGYELVAQGMGSVAILDELGPENDDDRVLANAMAAILILLLDDLNHDVSLDPRDLIYPFEHERHSADRHREFVDRIRGLFRWIVADVPSHWADLIADAHNLAMVWLYNEQLFRGRPIGFHLYTHLRAGTAGVPYANVMNAYVRDAAEWFSPARLIPVKTFEIEVSLLFGYANDLISFVRDDDADEAVNAMRLIEPGDDPVGLVLAQAELVRDRYDQLRGDEYADCLFRQVKSSFCMYLVERRHFDRAEALVQREMVAEQLGFDIPARLIESGLV